MRSGRVGERRPSTRSASPASNGSARRGSCRGPGCHRSRRSTPGRRWRPARPRARRRRSLVVVPARPSRPAIRRDRRNRRRSRCRPRRPEPGGIRSRTHGSAGRLVQAGQHDVDCHTAVTLRRIQPGGQGCATLRDEELTSCGSPTRPMTARVLVVDDDPAVAEVVVDYLWHAGMESRHAADGSGVRLAGEWRPDLVVLDVMLPGIDGWRCAVACETHGARRPAAGDHADRPRRRERPGPGAGDGCRRLRDQTVQPPGAGPARAGRAAARRRTRGGNGGDIAAAASGRIEVDVASRRPAGSAGS